MNKGYEIHSERQIEKIGNTIIFLINTVSHLSKTKLLKLLYILDEESIKESGRPFFNLKYKVWQLGPVNTDLFYEFSTDITILSKFISREIKNGRKHFEAKREFCDDTFSDDDIELLEKVARAFKDKTTEEIVEYTHQQGGLWNRVAKQNGILDELESKKIQTSDFEIDFTVLIKDNKRKERAFQQYQLLF